MTQIFLDNLNIPKTCAVNKTIFKKLFQENVVLDATDKKALKDDIKKITWLFSLKSSNIGIAKYEDENFEYHEIAILQVNLSNKYRFKKIANFINKAIPYPIILLFSFDNKFIINLTNKRINKVDRSKLLIAEEFFTDELDSKNLNQAQKSFIYDCNIKNLSSLNLYEFYQDLVARLISLNAASYSGIYNKTSTVKVLDCKKYLKQITDLEEEISSLQATLKKESQFNRQVDLNIKIKSKANEIQKLKQNL